jgi:hypothetical protein
MKKVDKTMERDANPATAGERDLRTVERKFCGLLYSSTGKAANPGDGEATRE